MPRAATQARPRQPKSLPAFVEGLAAALKASTSQPPVEKRKFSTILSQCGRKHTSVVFQSQLADAIVKKGIHVSPPIADAVVQRKDWIRFSTTPIPPESLLFPSEKDLRQFVVASIGRGVFRNLQLHRENGVLRCREYKLANGKRIDLLCDEKVSSGPTRLVAIELKRGSGAEAAYQIVDYLEGLRRQFKGRQVRGIVITGIDEPVTAFLTARPDLDITVFRYDVSFRRVR